MFPFLIHLFSPGLKNKKKILVPCFFIGDDGGLWFDNSWLQLMKLPYLIATSCEIFAPYV